MANDVIVRLWKGPGQGWRPANQVRRGRRRTGVRAGTRPAPPWYTHDWGDVVWRSPFDRGPVTNIETRSAKDVVGEGALRGRSPRTREGRLGPTAQKSSGQWSVVSCQRRCYWWLGVDGGLVMALLPAGVLESSTPSVGCTLFDFCFDMGGCFCYDSRLTCFEEAFTIRILETGCGGKRKREMPWKTKS